jgi:hypothetical protein
MRRRGGGNPIRRSIRPGWACLQKAIPQRCLFAKRSGGSRPTLRMAAHPAEGVPRPNGTAEAGWDSIRLSEPVPKRIGGWAPPPPPMGPNRQLKLADALLTADGSIRRRGPLLRMGVPSTKPLAKCSRQLAHFGFAWPRLASLRFAPPENGSPVPPAPHCRDGHDSCPRNTTPVTGVVYYRWCTTSAWVVRGK